ncbi:hypothetical protein [Kitasatospora aureofaciens]|uniref:hypothetical protein n=1 Tax=Kitasatospora aureofaciens TaxID=1894 RepID=UPI0033E2D3DE
MTTRSPAYEAGNVIEETGPAGRRLLVVAVGEEAYFVRRLDASYDVEPREAAWAHEGCEENTRLVPQSEV